MLPAGVYAVLEDGNPVVMFSSRKDALKHAVDLLQARGGSYHVVYVCDTVGAVSVALPEKIKLVRAAE